MHRSAPLLLCLLSLATACRSTGEGAPRTDPLFAAYRVERFDELTGLRYTFHARLGARELARAWEWEPRTGRVRATSPDEPFEATVYFRGAEGPPESSRELDARFINDQYWLLFPVHAARDAGARPVERGPATSPIEGLELRQLTVQYMGEGGYTPGDAYDLFLDADGIVREWVYRRDGGEEPTRTARWSEPVELGPILASLEFDGPDPAEFRVWFTDVAVRVEGEDAWRPVD